MEFTPSNGKYTYFIYAGNKLVAEETNGVVKYYHGDHLGSTRLMTDASGVVVASYKFKPYGEREAYSGSFSAEYQFTGKLVNDEVGLSYFGARFYDPETGRFLTQDPAKQGLNWYSYCLNNPINKIDPDGRFAEDAFIGDAVVVGGLLLLSYCGCQFAKDALTKMGQALDGLLKSNSSLDDRINDKISSLPKNPNDLVAKGWKDVTPPGMKDNTGSREFVDPITGLKVRYDPGEPGATGYKGKDHYHVYNPESTGKGDYYLDENGDPCAKNSKDSHVSPEEQQ
ncbi:MAG TPA: RHS repeat-associated core domain-containing protein [Bacillota bacterium]|nr:RHS repeat-associated core domain-containing protein [Bacillota bacterium]